MVTQRVLFVIPSLEAGGAAKQLALLAPSLPSAQLETRVCALGSTGLFARPLHDAGLPVHALGWKRPLDLRRLLAFQRLVRDFDPHVLHVFGISALRVATLAGIGWGNALPRPRVVVGTPFGASRKGRQTTWLDGWLLRRADRVAVSGPAEAERCRGLGVVEDRIAVVRPAVAAPERAAGCDAVLRRLLGVSDMARVAVCVGPLVPHKGFGEGLWAYEILKFLYDDMHLAVIGEGPDRGRLDKLAAINKTGGIHFLGLRTDAAALLAQADVVWVPSLSECGVNVALEAMAAARPVVASALPGLTEIVADRKTGYLIAPGDRGSLARQSRLLLQDGEQRRRFGEMGKQRALSQFAVADSCRQVTALYDSVLGGATVGQPDRNIQASGALLAKRAS